MPRIQTVDEAEATGIVKEEYDAFGREEKKLAISKRKIKYELKQ